MTLTYTIINLGVAGDVRHNIGKVYATSSEDEAFVNTGLRIGYHFGAVATTSGDVVRTYPASLPDRVDQSGYITVLFTGGEGTYLEWEAYGTV
jgi:hypothetical protein